VVSVTRAQDALQRLLAGEQFDLILCDLMMPEMTGMDVFAYLKRERPHLTRRVIFMTGGAFTQGARAFLEQVPNPSLDKPFDMERLRAVIRDLV
jgi:CheY-like chemotaxis protein